MDTTFQVVNEVEPLLTISQVAKLLSVSLSTAYRLTDTKELKSIRFFGSIRVRMADLNQFIEDHQTE